MNDPRPIGVFDSGIGGLTIAHEINKILPKEKIIYFGDTQHMPYGNKSNKKIIYYSNKIFEFLIKKQCKAIIVACNSASSVAIKQLMQKETQSCILLNVIDPLINAIKKDLSIKNIGVIGTNATIESNIYKTRIYDERSDVKVYSLATPLLASLIEEDNAKLYDKGIIESYLSHENFKTIDTLILGCTHYPLIEKKILDFYQKKIKIISSLNYFGEYVKNVFEQKDCLNQSPKKPKHQFYVSDYTNSFQKNTKLFFPTSIILREENIFS